MRIKKVLLKIQGKRWEVVAEINPLFVIMSGPMPDEEIGEIIQKKADDVPNGIKRGEKYVDEQGRELKNIAEIADEKQFVKEAFDGGGKLKKNASFSQGEFGYINETDELGRLSKAQTHDLQLSVLDRLPHKDKTPGKIDGDHAGHLFGDRFGGSPELDNLVSQASNVNLSKFKKIENQWAKAISEGKKVDVEIKVNYNQNELRPSSFEVNYTIDGKDFNSIIRN